MADNELSSLSFFDPRLCDSPSVSLPGFIMYTSPSILHFSHGCTAVFVARHLAQTQLPTDQLSSAVVEVTAAKVSFGKDELTVASVYIRRSSAVMVDQIPDDFLQQVQSSLPGPLLLCGDLNAHHPLWGSCDADRRGRRLVQSLEDCSLLVANTGEITFYRPPVSSAIDVTLHTLDVPAHWEVGMDSWGSDHFPIDVTLAYKHRAPKRRTTIVVWDSFRACLDGTPASQDICENIRTVLAAATKSGTAPATGPKPDLKYFRLCAIRGHAAALPMEAVLSIPDQQHIGPETLVCRQRPGGEEEGEPLQLYGSSQRGVLEELVEDFADLFGAGRDVPSTAAPPASPTDLDHPFTSGELRFALDHLKAKSAPGMDGLTYQCLQNLPDKTTSRLLDSINQCWDQAMPPPSWKESLIVPILKQGKPPGELSSYRPISLTSCFRRNLCCQDSVLDLVSDVDAAAQRKRRMAVVFFDIKAAFDSVPINTVMDSLVDPGIGGKAAAFIRALLSDRSFRVRLGSTLSSPRRQNLGLPQGSILSPLLFNLVMAGLPKALPATTPPLQLSIYADDICLWTNGKGPWKVKKTIQEGVDATTEYIRGLGFTPSAEKTRVMLLGSTANWSSWAPLVKDLQTRCKTTLNVTKRLSGRHSGCPQRTLLTIHNATRAARMLFGLPYAKPNRTALESLELLHRRGLKLALGLPPGARNVAVYAEATTLPLQLRATQHLLNQLTRLNRTATGRALLQRLRDRQRSRFSCTLFTQDQLFQPIPPVPSPDAPWRHLGTAIHTTLPGLPRKKDVPDAVAQFLAAERLHESYQDYLYTDASVDPGRRACALACHIPSTQFSWAEGLSGSLSSTEAELLAITEALDIIAKTSATKAVILTDSRGALSKLNNSYEHCPLSFRAHQKLQLFLASGHRIALQWIPSHKGIPGNEIADSLSKQATTKNLVRQAPSTTSQAKKSIAVHVRSFHPDKPTAEGTAPPPCITAGLTRDEASLLLRLRASCAFTRAYGFTIGLVDDPRCGTCGVQESLAHLITRCRDTASQRDLLFQNLSNAGITDHSLVTLVYPMGPRHHRRRIQRELLQFLSSTGLDTRL
ncbi:uncharacterized protein LOC135398500 [Ornithodoros turicata]|uniref:uncharacterized protein LOC135398500 n=1 Tax=Ornithodoros turicata TaxID=34597 RepID=UPI003138FB0D